VYVPLQLLFVSYQHHALEFFVLQLIVVGTEADDKYVVSSGEVFGGGLTIAYTNIESLEVTGEAGDDTFFILSKSPDLAM